MIDWPSDKVAPGGVFHMKKASYSKDTEDLLKGTVYLNFESLPSHQSLTFLPCSPHGRGETDKSAKE